MVPTGVSIRKEEVEVVAQFIEENKPVSYEDVLEQFPKAMWIIPLLEKVGGIEKEDTYIQNVDTAEAMEILIAEKYKFPHPGKRHLGFPG